MAGACPAYPRRAGQRGRLGTAALSHCGHVHDLEAQTSCRRSWHPPLATAGSRDTSPAWTAIAASTSSPPAPAAESSASVGPPPGALGSRVRTDTASTRCQGRTSTCCGKPDLTCGSPRRRRTPCRVCERKRIRIAALARSLRPMHTERLLRSPRRDQAAGPRPLVLSMPSGTPPGPRRRCRICLGRGPTDGFVVLSPRTTRLRGPRAESVPPTRRPGGSRSRA